MKRTIHIILLTALLLGLPLCGVWVAGYDISAYLQFPPRTQLVEHAPFSWPVCIGLAIVILSVMLPFLVRIAIANRSRPQISTADSPICHFPWWGWLSLALGVLFWFLAWTRFQWMSGAQLYTFTPQWLCYIVTINALTFRRIGRCLLTHETRFFFGLFPLSAAFWWFFEYLNHFTQNWWYTCGADFTPLQYFFAATLPFSTVLPAVLSTEAWLSSHPKSSAGLDSFFSIRISKPRIAAWLTLVISGAGLFFVGWFPDYLFPLLWLAPLLLLMAFRVLEKQPAFFSEIGMGDWRRVYRLCLAGLICGFFWELWNGHSLAKWIYSIPFVDRFHIFEMPLLGYAGYLPFGLECAVIATLLKRS